MHQHQSNPTIVGPPPLVQQGRQVEDAGMQGSGGRGASYQRKHKRPIDLLFRIQLVLPAVVPLIQRCGGPSPSPRPRR